MKVKKFRIKPRPSVVGRILKTLLSAKKLDPLVEESLPLEIQDMTSHLVPAAFYQTWSKEDVPAPIAGLLPSLNLDRTVAVSFAVATTGPQLEERLSECLMKGETTRAQVITAIGEESADLAFQFISRLLQEDAQSDGCDLSDPVFLTQNDALFELFREMEAHVEEVSVDSAGHLSPRFTRVALLGWAPISKKKRAAALSHKRIV